MSRSTEVGLAATCGLVVVAVTGFETMATIVILLIMAASSVIATRLRVGNRQGGSTDRLASVFAGIWLVLLLGPAHQFTKRPIGDAVAAPGLESGFEFLYFSAGAGLAILAVRSVRRDLGATLVPFPLLALPAFATISFLWSATYFYTFGRGLQLVATAVLAWGTANLGLSDPAFMRAVVERVARWYIRATLVLVSLGIVLGPMYASGSAKNQERFTWIGTHALSVAAVTGVAIVAIVAVPSDVSRLRGGWRLAALALVGYGAYGAQGRTALVALAVALTYLLANAIRTSRFARYVSLPYVLAAVSVAAFYFRDQLLDYFYRGNSAGEVSSGNGRGELWSDAYRLLETPFDWAFGLGFGRSREVFLTAEKSWAKSAHSSVLGIFVNLGIIGLVLLALWIGYTVIAILKARFPNHSMGNALTALFAYSIVHALAAESVSNPGSLNAMVMFVGAAAISALRAPDGGWTHVPRPSEARGSPVR